MCIEASQPCRVVKLQTLRYLFCFHQCSDLNPRQSILDTVVSQSYSEDEYRASSTSQGAMIPEPFTAVVAGVGLLSGLLALFVNSVRTVHETYKDFRDCSDKLQLLNSRVEDIEKELRTIKHQWGTEKSWGEDAYIRIFGVQANTAAAQRAQNVERFMEAVLDVFRKGYDMELRRDHVGPLPENTPGVLEPGDKRVWKKWAKGTFDISQGNVRRVATLDVPVATRIAFAMIRRPDLETKVDSLEQAMKTLSVCLKRNFEQLPDICGKSTQPKAVFFASMLRLQTSNDDFARYVTDVHETANAKGKACGIFLDIEKRELMYQNHLDSPPKPIELLMSMKNFPDFKIIWPGSRTFAKDLEQRISQGDRGEFMMAFAADEDFANEPVDVDQPTNASELVDPIDKPDSLYNVYTRMREWDNEESAVYQKCSEDERWRMILSLFATTNLLWITPWMTKLCTCNVEPRYTGTAESQFLIWPDPAHRPEPCQHVEGSTWKDTNDDNEERLARLGILICEIALCSPVKTDNSGGTPAFSYRKRVPQPDATVHYVWHTSTSPWHLLQDVWDAMKGLKESESLSMLIELHYPRPERLHFLATYMDACGLLAKDHDKLKRHYEDVFDRHRRGQSNRAWYRTLEQEHHRLQGIVQSSRPPYTLSASALPHHPYAQISLKEDASDFGDREPARPIRRAIRTVSHPGASGQQQHP